MSMFKKDPCLTVNPSSYSIHSPQGIIPTHIKKGTVVLDVGCNTGYLAKVLRKKHVICDGIDINKEALAKAKKYCRKVYRRDLYSGRLNIDNSKYDYILFMDLLEHIPRPDLLLKNSLKYLKNSGRIIISLPNVARAEIRLQLFFGNFDYTYGGILNEDHLRHFTRRSAVKMIQESSLQILEIIPTGLGHQLRIFPTLTAFQFIYVCQKK